MNDRLLALIAARFKALAEPARLALLNQLRCGEQSVTELLDATGLAQANASRHLQLLFNLNFVRRRRVGQQVLYSLADKSVVKLCDFMCDRVEYESRRQLENPARHPKNK